MNFIFNLYAIFSFAPIALVLHCVFIFLFKRWLGPVGTFYTSILSFSFVLIISMVELYQLMVHGSYAFVDFGRWFFCLDLIDSHLVFCVDPLALVSSILVLTLTMFALYFGVEYMYREAFINRLLYLLNLFATSVVFLFYCYDYFLILFAWECIGLFSLLLVNFYSTRVYTIKAALKTFIFSRISDMFMFVSFILTVNVFNTTDLSLIFIQTPFFAFHYIFFGKTALHFITLFSFCLVTSGVIKAAQFFFHVWLPDAMEAPTPASALIHSSTLVVAGIFLIIRFSILFEFTVFTNYYLAVLGALTLSFASVTAAFQSDIKKLVAYSTISQIGYLVCGCGFCCYEEVLIYLIIHALNKAFLFVLVGYIVHFFSGNTDMRQMGGAYLYSFDVAVLLFGVCLNLAGLPYSAGFLGKEFLLFQVLRDDFLTLFVRGCWLVSFFFTPIYIFIPTFIVMFGVKKGSLVSYSGVWDFNQGVNMVSVYSELWWHTPILVTPLVEAGVWSVNPVRIPIPAATLPGPKFQVLDVKRYVYLDGRSPRNWWLFRFAFLLWTCYGLKRGSCDLGLRSKPTEFGLMRGSTWPIQVRFNLWSRKAWPEPAEEHAGFPYEFSPYIYSLAHDVFINRSLTGRYHFTSITSRLTSYFLLFFWGLFFFCGESLLLIVLNYATLVDTVGSSSFLNLKQHVVFFLVTTPSQLVSYINFYIYFLTACSFLFLINFNYSYSYYYFSNNIYTPAVMIIFGIFSLVLKTL